MESSVCLGNLGVNWGCMRLGDESRVWGIEDEIDWCVRKKNRDRTRRRRRRRTGRRARREAVADLMRDLLRDIGLRV